MNQESFPEKELRLLQTLDSPSHIQDFLDAIPFNYEKYGETCLSAYRVIKEKKAHCIEGAFLACAALLFHKKNPIIVNLKVAHKDDHDHIITIYKENGYYGAISKTNHNVLRFRDPIYKTIRELVLSYFHEYFLVTTGEKTLLGYSKPINLKRFGRSWVTGKEDLWDIAEQIYNAPTIAIVPQENKKYIRKASAIERTAAKIPQWKK